MRVLMVRMTDRISGTEVYNLNLLQGFADYSDIKISFLTNSKYFVERIKEKDADVFFINNNLQEVGTKRNFLKALIYSPIFISSFISTIRKIEKGEKFSLICLQSMTEKIFISPFLKLLNYKIVWIEHGPLFISSRAKLIKFLYILASIFVNKIIAVSKDTQEDLLKGGVKKNKILNIYIGIGTESFSPLTVDEIKKEKKKMNISSDNFVIGFLGSVNKEKGIENFVDVSKRILDKNKNVTFLIIGDGPMLNYIKGEVKILKINNNYVFTGFIDDVKNYLGILDVLFFPTKHHEGLSISLLESLSMGIPVLANDIGGNKELIKNNQTGFLYNAAIDTNEEVANKILEILNNKKVREKISQNSQNYINGNFNLKKSSKEFYNLFKNL